jgi:hypothetical protein
MVSVWDGVNGKKSAVSVAGLFLFIGTAARRVSHIRRRARYQLLGFFDSLAQPRDASATSEEERGINCWAFSFHWHCRETRQPHPKKSAVSIAGLFLFIGTAARRVSHIRRRVLYQLLGFFGSLAQPRDASATFQKCGISCGAFSFYWHGRETRQAHPKKSCISCWGPSFLGE